MVIDTDVIIRFLTADDRKKADKFADFLSSGKKAFLTDVTFAEVYWTLTSFYKFDKEKAQGAMISLINHPSIKCDKKILEKTIQLIKEKNISFIDAYNASFSLLVGDSKILSYDRGFNKIEGLKRLEP